ncbi:MAG: hypothetical protein GXZ15_01420 [Campylobacter sp.]|nr:hypothetical protein [Campylobacter sp.]
MNRVKKIVAFSLASGFGLILAGGLSGCENNNNSEKEQKATNGAFVVIEEVLGGGYKILEEFPSAQTRIILKQLDGTERVLTQEEMNFLIAQENVKIENGTSNLINPDAQLSSGGLSLGEAVLASSAGVLIGSWIGSKLFNNPAYQNGRQQAYKNPSSYQRSVSNFQNAKQNKNVKKSTSGRSGFYNGGAKSSSSTGG